MKVLEQMAYAFAQKAETK